jgi:tRNA 2-thiouridine synthesizing protein E
LCVFIIALQITLIYIVEIPQRVYLTIIVGFRIQYNQVAEVDGKIIQLSEAGWLENLNEWSVDLAHAIAKNEKVELTDEHWDIINEARDFFQETGKVCEPRAFSKIMKKKYGKDRSDSKYIYSLFPYGLIKSANKIGGLPRPKGCS